MALALAVNLFILCLGNEAKVSVEDHLVDSIVILELTLKRISAAVSNSEAFQIELEVSSLMKPA